MNPAALPMLLVGLLLCGGPSTPDAGGSHLCQPAFVLDYALRCPTASYAPQPGDIMFSTDDNPIWLVLFKCAFTGHPHHSAIVVARCDGRLAVLESGPHDTLHVELLDPLPHMQSYDRKGRVWIRKRRVPLTADESARLTAFAEAQNRKRFAICRLGGQLTPFRCRGPLRTQYVGGPHGERSSYFCCELVMEACVAAGLVDPVTTRPSATFPSDIFFDESVNRWVNRHLKLAPNWDPPARWTGAPLDMSAAPAPSKGSAVGVP